MKTAHQIVLFILLTLASVDSSAQYLDWLISTTEGDAIFSDVVVDDINQRVYAVGTFDGDNVGAYRVGMGESIMARLGPKGFYTSSLFRYKQPIRRILPKCVELGRSFVQIDYQKHRLPLFLLWKGIMSILLNHPAYQYVIGPVSISNDYSDYSKGLIMEFIQRYHFNHDLAQYVKPKNQFVPKFKQSDREALLNSTNKDLKKLDRLISDIEPSSFSVPVLLKKYLYQNAKILGFNSDPKFNNALDGLIFLDFSDIPASMIASLQSDLKEALT